MTGITVGLPEIVAGLIVVALNAYALTGGADFGGGVWELLARGPRREAQRALVARALAPIWEANHVWLILVVVMLFTAFPDVFATLGIILHVPLSLMLIGIVLRGSAFVFRSYDPRDDSVRRRWGRLFAVASIVTPGLLGMVIGAIASGAVGDAARRLAGARAGSPSSDGFVSIYVRPWVAPFPIITGVLALTMFAFLAAVYLAVAATDDALREDFRRRALAAAGAVLVMAGAGLVAADVYAPDVLRSLLGGGWASALQLATGVAALACIAALWTRRWQLARVAAAGQVSLILWGWVAAQYPWMIPETHAIRTASAPAVTLKLLLVGVAVGAVILLPSLAYLYRTFARADTSAA
jgi:cytochrome d ubiquinol oxidase subunit II